MAQSTVGDIASHGGSTAPGPAGPTAQEAALFFHMIKNMQTLPDIDWDAVAVDMGFKNAAVAKKRFYQIKVKLGLGHGTVASPTKSSPGKASTPRKPRCGSKAALEDNSEEGEDGTPVLTPTKVAKRRKSTAAAATPTAGRRGRKAATATAAAPVDAADRCPDDLFGRGHLESENGEDDGDTVCV